MDLHKDIVSANAPEAFPGKFKKITEFKADFQCRENRAILEANAIKNVHFRKRKSSPGFMALKDDTFLRGGEEECKWGKKKTQQMLVY